jgi:hypothetical protein
MRMPNLQPKKREIIAADQMLAYLPLLQNLAVMMKDRNTQANLAFLMKAQEDSANINSDQKNRTPDQQTHISEKNGNGKLESLDKSEKIEKDNKMD